MNKDLWDKCVEFHGHECPGLAIGYRAAVLASEIMDLDFARDEEIVCITENDACAVDAVQVITGCTIGKGNLIYEDKGKMAFTFISRENGESLRLMLKQLDDQMNKKEKQNFILTGDADKIYKINKLNINLPEEARIFNTVICEKCDEGTAEHRIRLEDGKKLCLDCITDYSRGW